MVHKASGVVELVAVETVDGHYQDVLESGDRLHARMMVQGNLGHRSLGHFWTEALTSTARHGRGVSIIGLKYTSECAVCTSRKVCGVTKKASGNRGSSGTCTARSCLHDVVGSIKHRSIGRSKIIVALLDCYSGYSLVRFIDRKSGASDAVIEMALQIENLFNNKNR